MKTRKSRKRIQARNRKGAVAVEMAMTLSLLFFIAFAAYETSRANMIRHTVEAACYEGARQAILPGATVAQVEEGANFVLRSIGARNASIVVIPTPLTNNVEQIEVEITLPLNDNMTFAPFLFKDGVIVRRCTMAKEELF